jgi:hypothetical protein
LGAAEGSGWWFTYREGWAFFNARTIGLTHLGATSYWAAPDEGMGLAW